MKKIILILVIVAIVAIAMVSKNKIKEDTNNDTSRVGEPSGEVVAQNPVTFTGKLQEVNTGCFADGECFVTVDGKHVRVLMGWSRDTVGKVLGGDGSIGGLEGSLGKDVEVYANKLDETNYTLYGSETYYVKLK